MILSVHAIFGAAVASLVPTHPVAAFGLGFVSHFILDAIPHKDYKLLSLEKDENKKVRILENFFRQAKFFSDIALVSLDALVGVCLAFLLFFNYSHPFIFLLGVAGSFLPDFLTFLYLILKHRPLGIFFNFHDSFVHSKIILKLNQLTGVFLQFFTVAILIVILLIIGKFLI